MEIKDNYSITKLFINKEIKVFIDDVKYFILVAPTVKDLYENEDIIVVQNILLKTLPQWKKETNIQLNHVFDYIKLIFFDLGSFKEYSKIAKRIRDGIKALIPQVDFNFKTKSIMIDDITMTDEICDYVIYLLKLLCGEKITQPQVFSSPEARAFFEQQQKYDEQIGKLKEKNKKSDKDGLIKSLLLITYSFPSLTFDYLFEQTLAQIHWLSQVANSAVSYSFNEKVMAAGNVKKGTKLDFFIK